MYTYMDTSIQYCQRSHQLNKVVVCTYTMYQMQYFTIIHAHQNLIHRMTNTRAIQRQYKSNTNTEYILIHILWKIAVLHHLLIIYGVCLMCFVFVYCQIKYPEQKLQMLFVKLWIFSILNF